MTFDELNAMFTGGDGMVSIMTPDERRYIWGLVAKLRGTVVEVGSAYGGTTLVMAHAGAERVYSVDNWQCGQREVFLRNIDAHAPTGIVESIVGDSVETAPQFADESCSVVLIDANHDGEHPLKDIVAYAPKVKLGGYLLVDDTGPAFPDVERAIVWINNDPRFKWDAEFMNDGPCGDNRLKMQGWKRVA